MINNVYSLAALIIVLIFVAAMWPKIVASIMSIGFTLGVLAILVGAGFVFGKIFRVF
jgi:hypothetical protein